MSTAPHILSSSDCTGGVSVSLLPGKQKPGVQLFTSFPMDSELNSWKKALSWFYRKYSSKFTATTSGSSLTQAQGRSRPLPTEDKREQQDNSHCSCGSSLCSWRGESKIWHQSQGCNRQKYLSSKQKYPSTVFQLCHCHLKAKMYMKNTFWNFL